MKIADFVIVGSSGGGGTIGWLLAKAGYSVVMLEVGPDFSESLEHSTTEFDSTIHDEYRFRLEKPDPKRRPRGDYVTRRKPNEDQALPFSAGWTASVLGGGSMIWGTWAFRALPIDFVLRTHFKATGQLIELEQAGYSIQDWPVTHREMEPYYNVAETLLGVSGDRPELNSAVRNSSWFQAFAGSPYFDSAGNWAPTLPFPCGPYPRTPVGEFFYQGAAPAKFNPIALPSAIVQPGSSPYGTREALRKTLGDAGAPDGEFWKRSAEMLWSDRVRAACNMCGYCGEYLCWGKSGPKAGTRMTTIAEMKELPNVEIRANSRAYEVIYDEKLRRATGVRYLDVSNPDDPKLRTQEGAFVIVSCGAVQSARLLLMSGGPKGLGNTNDQVGRNAMFHLFGLGIVATLPKTFNGTPMQGLLHGEFGHTGNTTSFEPYFVKDPESGKWWKGGTMTSTAKKNPLENADGKLRTSPPTIGRQLLEGMEGYNRSLEVRLTGDDLPMPRNRVDLDPTYVDEYGLPVARITRDFGLAENKMFQLAQSQFDALTDRYVKIGLLASNPKATPGKLDLVGDHQMGTCRMGDDPATSVVDRNCRMHEVPNVFVVDSSFFPTGFGLNPMVTVVANALRVGTWISQEMGKELV